ncbi:hypothetical protein [Marinivivus vitaminiproducens]|uniref:hypothetical protein n=1 Tax=Marinivivus vitaminiproducens TaxID=3035935 RepID=UPI0027A2BA5D|nr:hypothetical protein P4R82_17390 [Geminicoccaceae bacterium SCSIO 64248]
MRTLIFLGEIVWQLDRAPASPGVSMGRRIVGGHRKHGVGGMTAPDLMMAVALAAAALELGANGLYLRHVCLGHTVPTRMTWLIWTPLAWMGVMASIEAGATLTVIKLVMSATGTTAIMLLALRYGSGGLSRSDQACLGITVAGVCLWQALDDPVLGIVFFLIADAAGAVPSLRDAWHAPRKERVLPWLLGLFSCLLALSVVELDRWGQGWAGFGIWVIPFYLALVNGSMVLLLCRPDRPAVAAVPAS